MIYRGAEQGVSERREQNLTTEIRKLIGSHTAKVNEKGEAVFEPRLIYLTDPPVYLVQSKFFKKCVDKNSWPAKGLD